MITRRQQHPHGPLERIVRLVVRREPNAQALALVTRNKRARGSEWPAVANARNAEVAEAQYDDATDWTLGSETDRRRAR